MSKNANNKLNCPHHKSFKENIKDLFKREFLFDRHDETTGLVMFESGEETVSGEKECYHYRGFTLWIKEIFETFLAWGMIVFFVIFIWKNFSSFWNPMQFTFKLASEILTFAGAILILDSILLVAALISSPGIDETIDSISVSIAGVFILYLGYMTPEIIVGKINEGGVLVEGHSSLILKIMLPVSVIIILLITAKHFLKRLRRVKKN